MSSCGYIGISLDGGVSLDGPEGGAAFEEMPDETDSGDGGAKASGGAPGSGGGQKESGGSGGLGMGGELDVGGSGGSQDSSGGESSGGAAPSGGSQGDTGGNGSATCDTNEPTCASLAQALVHRYSFEGADTEVVDSIGTAHGVARGTTLDGSGAITLSGENDYVDLPSGLVSSLPNASFEIWFVWHGGEPWQKLFEFGDREFFLDPTCYLYLTPRGGGSVQSELSLAAGLRHPEGGDRQLRTNAFTEIDVLTHVVLTADDTFDRLTLFKNGQWVAERETDVRLNDLQDRVNRLGQSLFPDDPALAGQIMEFRIYDKVLSPEMVDKSYSLGPEVIFLD